ncbi:MAG: hypothetical protein ABIN95_07785 [Mucilaginibacter sp.]
MPVKLINFDTSKEDIILDYNDKGLLALYVKGAIHDTILYNSKGNVIQIDRYANGSIWARTKFTLNSLGDAQKVDFYEIVSGVEKLRESQMNTFNSKRQLTTRQSIYPGETTPRYGPSTFEYDETGNLIKETYTTGTYAYTYDSRNGIFKNANNILLLSLLNIELIPFIVSNPTAITYTYTGEGTSEPRTYNLVYTYHPSDYPISFQYQHLGLPVTCEVVYGKITFN